MTFYTYQSKKNKSIYVAVRRKEEPRPNELPDHSWFFSKEIPDDGKGRTRFDPNEVKRGIAAKGYHIFQVKVDVKEVFGSN